MLEGNPVYVLGLSGQGTLHLSDSAKALLRRADIVYGREDVLNQIPDGPGKYPIHSPLHPMAEHLKRHSLERRVVLATGDPNFFGIAEFLYRTLGPDSVYVIPQVSSIQRAFAKIKMSWHDAYFGSVHGRPVENVVPWVVRHAKVAVLTDPRHHAGKIAQILVAHGLGEIRMFVCENLDMEREEISQAQAIHVQHWQKGGYAVVVILNHRAGQGHFGIDDGDFDRRPGQPGMITKKPVRAVAIAQLGLRPDSVLWDVGAGTGSVAIDASRVIGIGGQIFAIERNERDFDILCVNIRHHQTAVTPILGEAPEIFTVLPDPDSVFIGGSGGRFQEIVERVLGRLKPGGVMVLNLVRLDRAADIGKLLPSGCSWNVQLIQTSVMDWKMPVPRFRPDNPVFVATVQKPGNEE